MKKFFTIIALFALTISFAQNLVVSQNQTYTISSSANYSNVEIKNNGTLYITNGAIVTIDDCLIKPNGRIYVQGNSQVTIDELEIKPNGVMYVDGNSFVNIDELEIDANGVLDIIDDGQSCVSYDEAEVHHNGHLDANASTTPCTGNTLSVGDTAFVKSVSIYPNPVSNFVNIKLQSNDNATALLVNTVGQVIRNNKFNGTTRLDVSDLSSGFYFVKIQSGSNTATIKIVKQ